MKRIPLALIIAAAGATPLLAQDMIDLNEDGYLSLTEVQTAYPDVTEADFTLADTNGDGLLDEDELAAAREAELIPMADEEGADG
jgi:hypothetical protein